MVEAGISVSVKACETPVDAGEWVMVFRAAL